MKQKINNKSQEVLNINNGMADFEISSGEIEINFALISHFYKEL